MTFKKLSGMVLSVVFTAGTLLAWNATASADRTIKLAGFGVKSGVVRSFGINTEAVLNAAVKHVNESGGVKLVTAPVPRWNWCFTTTAAKPRKAFRS